MATLGLITVLFKSDDVLEGFFKSLSIQSYKDYHLYIVDNQPTEDTGKLLAKLAEKYTVSKYSYLKNVTNVGVAKANNQGIELSLLEGCKYSLILNNDIEFEQPDLLGDLLHDAEIRNENLISPKILYFDSRKIWMAGGKINFWLGLNSHFGIDAADSALYNEEKYVTYAPTCFMLIRNTVFKDIGVMDEQYFVYYDDTDFVYRALKKGYQLLYLPKYIILHKVSSSTGGEESPFAIYYMLRNRILFLRKNFKSTRFIVGFSHCALYCVYLYIKHKKNRKTIFSAFFEGLNVELI